jgi:hypothetical protein
MTTEAMTDDIFARLADLHGGRIADWPAGAQAPAWAWLVGSAPARAALARAAALDAALADLAAAPAPAVSDALMARMMADADRAIAAPACVAAPLRPRAQRGVARPAPRRALARLAGPAALAASALLGVMVGWSAPSTLTDTLLSVAASDDGTGDDTFLTAGLLPLDDPFAGF